MAVHLRPFFRLVPSLSSDSQSRSVVDRSLQTIFVDSAVTNQVIISSHQDPRIDGSAGTVLGTADICSFVEPRALFVEVRRQI